MERIMTNIKKIKSIVKNSFFLIILLLLTSNLGAESKWVKLSKTDREKAFKEFEYDKIKKTLTAKYNYAKEVTVPYSMCQEMLADTSNTGQ